MIEQPAYMGALRQQDPAFYDLIDAMLEKAKGKGDLDRKTKVLILLALGAAGSDVAAVKSLSTEARSIGASEGEIVETMRLAFIGAGIPGLVAGLAAFEGVS